MIVVLISPETDDPRERTVLAALMRTGSAAPERYHLRKPRWSVAETEAWLRDTPVEWRRRIVLHGHPALAEQFGVLGVHEKDGTAGALRKGLDSNPLSAESVHLNGAAADQIFRSTSRHELRMLKEATGRFDSVFYGPVFPSISKRGYGQAVRADEAELSEFLRTQRRTQVLAIGGVTAERLERCEELGFDGAAVLGAVWESADPWAAWTEIAAAAAQLERAHHAA
jgi:thiamine-phosphate pyrophosphorylase